MEDKKFIDRDLSWLSFNKRILEEAQDLSLPIYERIKFLAIYSSNLDEFFRVRVAAIRTLAGLGKKKIEKELDFDPKALLKELLEEVNEQLNNYGKTFREQIIPELAQNDIHIYYNEPLKKEHQKEVERYFKVKVLSFINPVFFKFHDNLFLESNNLYLVCCLENKEGESEYVHLCIPSHELPRFQELSPIEGVHHIIFLDDIIRENLGLLFPDHSIKGCYSIKVNRDQDVDLENKIEQHMVERIKKQLEKRKVGAPTRFLYDTSMPDTLLDHLKERINLKKKELVPGGRYHNMNDLMKLPNPKSPDLKGNRLTTIELNPLEKSNRLFDAIDKKDWMLHFPYQSYDYVLRFFNEAATDPCVTEIRATLYRVAANSTVAQALITAAKNGKKVEVFVELKARFDEANNIHWAGKMEEAGVNVTYSMEKLKVHAKVALVTRVHRGETKQYAFFGTGNFNENTAGIYADHGLLTCHNEMNSELNIVFDFLQHGKSISTSLDHLMVARVNMLDKLKALLDREIDNAKAGKEAYVLIKLNNLEEEQMIEKLYEASQAGVTIDLIIRGICRLRPQVEGLSENIRAVRIVDSFLEHARIFKFSNDGNPEYYLGSADWMNRNLHRRIEVNFPIYDAEVKSEIEAMLQLQLADNTKARNLDEDLNHTLVANDKEPIRSQRDFHQYLSGKYNS